MANDIGWGQPYSIENGFGMAAVNGALEGYGLVVVTSHSGQTNISSIDNDNEVSILTEALNLYVDGDNMYIYFQLAEDIVPQSMSVEIYNNDIFNADVALTMDGISWVAEYPATGNWYAVLTVNIDTETRYTFTSNTITV